jgi:putative transposase
LKRAEEGVSEAAFYVWRKKYGNLLPTEMKRLRQLEDENSMLKRIVAELSLDQAMLQDVNKKLLSSILILIN